MLTDEKLTDVFDYVRSRNHPDPVGFIARSDLSTGFRSDDFTGLSDQDAERLGIDGKSTAQDKLDAAIAIDIENYSAYENPDLTHVAFRFGKRAAENLGTKSQNYLERLSKKYTEIDDRLVDLVRDESAPIQADQVMQQLEQVTTTDISGQAKKVQSLFKHSTREDKDIRFTKNQDAELDSLLLEIVENA